MQSLIGKIRKLIRRKVQSQQLYLAQIVLVVLIEIENDIAQILYVVSLKRYVLHFLRQVLWLKYIDIAILKLQKLQLLHVCNTAKDLFVNVADVDINELELALVFFEELQQALHLVLGIVVLQLHGGHINYFILLILTVSERIDRYIGIN